MQNLAHIFEFLIFKIALCTFSKMTAKYQRTLSNILKLRGLLDRNGLSKYHFKLRTEVMRKNSVLANVPEFKDEKRRSMNFSQTDSQISMIFKTHLLRHEFQKCADIIENIADPVLESPSLSKLLILKFIEIGDYESGLKWCKKFSS